VREPGSVTRVGGNDAMPETAGDLSDDNIHGNHRAGDWGAGRRTCRYPFIIKGVGKG
jgi:hypothetical protein